MSASDLHFMYDSCLVLYTPDTITCTMYIRTPINCGTDDRVAFKRCFTGSLRQQGGGALTEAHHLRLTPMLQHLSISKDELRRH